MHQYKIGLAVFTQDKTKLPLLVSSVEKIIKTHQMGQIKTMDFFELSQASVDKNLPDLINTNLGMIILIAQGEFDFQGLGPIQDAGQRRDKLLLTINTHDNFEAKFQTLLNEVQTLPAKKTRGCEASCH